jgi:hypothetical protein
MTEVGCQCTVEGAPACRPECEHTCTDECGFGRPAHCFNCGADGTEYSIGCSGLGLRMTLCPPYPHCARCAGRLTFMEAPA